LKRCLCACLPCAPTVSMYIRTNGRLICNVPRSFVDAPTSSFVRSCTTDKTRSNERPPTQRPGLVSHTRQLARSQPFCSQYAAPCCARSRPVYVFRFFLPRHISMSTCCASVTLLPDAELPCPAKGESGSSRAAIRWNRAPFGLFAHAGSGRTCTWLMESSLQGKRVFRKIPSNSTHTDSGPPKVLCTHKCLRCPAQNTNIVSLIHRIGRIPVTNGTQVVLYA
jgi:hypothetical protein